MKYHWMLAVVLSAVSTTALAQPPRDDAGPSGQGQRGEGQRGQMQRGQGGRSNPAERLMQFDQDDDEVITKEELSDNRLASLFDRIDTNNDNQLTKEEVEAYSVESSSADNNRGRGRPHDQGPHNQGVDNQDMRGMDHGPRGMGGPGGGFPPEGRGGPGGRGEFGPGTQFGRGPGGPGEFGGESAREFAGGPGGPGGFGGPVGFDGPGFSGRGFGGLGFGGHPPKPGEVLPADIVNMLHLSESQRADLAKLQQEVDERLATILIDEQQATLEEMPSPPPMQRGGHMQPGGPRPMDGGMQGGGGLREQQAMRGQQPRNQRGSRSGGR